MTIMRISEPTYRRDLGDGLVLRWSVAADSERIGVLYSHVFRGAAADAPNAMIARWAHELMSGDHPLITAGDFALVEDTASGAIVAATCLMTQTWEYAGIALPVGRPEIVASLPEYRNRGLIRAIFALIHARSDDRGDLAQGITGIRYYYRQFDYEYALDLGGSKTVPFANIPKLKDGETELYTLRDASEADLPQLQALYDRERTRMYQHTPLLVSTRIDASYWQFRLRDTWRETGEGWLNKLLIDQHGRIAGYALLSPIRWSEEVQVRAAMVDEGVSLLAALPALLRALQAASTQLLTGRADTPVPAKISFGLGRAHPFYDALGTLTTSDEPPYAWYCAASDSPPLRLCEVKLAIGQTPLNPTTCFYHDLHAVTRSSLVFATQKNRERGEEITHGRSGHSIACPTATLLRRILHLRLNAAPPHTPLSHIYHLGQWVSIPSTLIMARLRTAAAALPHLGFPPSGVTARSLRSGGAMALLCGRVDRDVIKLVGRWRSDAMFRYLHAQAVPLVSFPLPRPCSTTAPSLSSLTRTFPPPRLPCWRAILNFPHLRLPPSLLSLDGHWARVVRALPSAKHQVKLDMPTTRFFVYRHPTYDTNGLFKRVICSFTRTLAKTPTVPFLEIAVTHAESRVLKRRIDTFVPWSRYWACFRSQGGL